MKATRIEVRLFAAARQMAGQEVIAVELSDATVGQLRQALAAQCPQLAPILDSVTFAVDASYATDETPLSAESEVACIPPVSGG